MIDLLRLSRPYYAGPMSFILGLTIVYARDGRMAGEWAGTILASLALSFIIAAGYVFNDVCDVAVDRINAPNRPIAAGRVRAGPAMLWALALLACGLAMGAFCRPAFLASLVALVVALAGYDLISKRLSLGKQLLVAALMTSIYPLAIAQAGGTSGGRATTLAFFPIWLFLTSFGYETLKDIRDLTGDARTSGRTTWIQRDPGRAGRTAATAIVIGAAVLIVPAFVGCGPVYSSIVGLAVLAAMAAALAPIRRAMILVYTECVVVGIAATADVLFASPNG